MGEVEHAEAVERWRHLSHAKAREQDKSIIADHATNLLDAVVTLDPGSWPNLKDGDCGPYGEPDEQLNAGDLVVAIRIALGELPLRALELAHCDLGTPDGDIDVADILLLIQMVQSLPGGI